MVASRHGGSADRSRDEANLVTRAKTLRDELSDTFARVLASQGLCADDLARLVRRLEHDPAARRALDAARREAGVLTTPIPRTSPALPRNPRALRV